VTDDGVLGWVTGVVFALGAESPPSSW
jgi:hypothetical protein